VSISSFLQGIQVIDLSRHLPGPLATLMLADMGAEVLKIEPPYGDELRSVGPEGPSGRSAYFDAANAGKRCRQLDLRSEEGRNELLRLVETADVVVESFRPRVLERLGVGFAAMRERNPRLVCCALNGFGVRGPSFDKAAHDINYLALGGTLSGTGPHDRPMFFYPPVADCSGAIFAVSAIVGALFRRTRTVQGCEIDLALADAVMPFHLFQLADISAQGKAPEREAGLMNGGAACYRIYPTSDGRFVSLGAIERKFWASFCEAAGHPEWIERQYEPTPQRLLIDEVKTFFAALTCEQAEAQFARADCCFAPVLSLEQAIASPHQAARGLLRKGADGLWQALFPAIVDGVPPRMREPLADETALPPSR
jgi:crotonobetainyl-CoA:carnitine CoA-transferase CaiB-like acyl-CoA transferase